MKLLKLIGWFGGGFVLGGLVIGGWCSHVYSRTMLSKEVEGASQAAEVAEWLAGLRLGQTQKVIANMEGAMDDGVGAIADWERVGQPDKKTREARDGYLIAVKLYHLSYPITARDSANVSGLLAKVPGRSPQSKCRNWTCQLDDLRLNASGAKTNSP